MTQTLRAALAHPCRWPHCCSWLGAAGGWLGGSQRVGWRKSAAIEEVVRDYILAHPEILPEAMENLRERETGKQLEAVAGKLETPFPGAVLGNPQGKVTLVEFTDFACTYCRASVADVEALIAANPDLKVVVRELPILSPQSADAARMGLAAAEQGKYPAFHKAMFAAGRPDPRHHRSCRPGRRARHGARRPRLPPIPKTEAELAATSNWPASSALTARPAGWSATGDFRVAVGRDRAGQGDCRARGS
jgi:hypothetical protein